MKKLFFTFVLFISVFTLSAQKFRVITTDGRIVENGESFYVYGQGNAWGELAIEFGVEALEDVQLIAQKVEIQVVEGTYNMLCLDQCYAPSVYVSPVVNFAANETKDFSMHYQYENAIEDVAGLEQIMEYYLYEEGSHEQFVINVTFKYSLDGIEDYNSAEVFSNAYPVPANDVVNFDYNFASSENAEVAIYNMMGQEVLRNSISGMSGKLSINVSDLTDGVYFYSLIVNGKTEKSSKLIIRK